MKLAIIAGDGIGPEVVGEAVKVLDAVLPGVEKTSYDLGARRYHATGEVLSESVLEELRTHVKTLLDPTAAPRELHIVEELPRRGIGKLDRRTLVARFGD